MVEANYLSIISHGMTLTRRYIFIRTDSEEILMPGPKELAKQPCLFQRALKFEPKAPFSALLSAQIRGAIFLHFLPLPAQPPPQFYKSCLTETKTRK